MSDTKKTRPQTLKARLPRGFADRSPADIRATEAMVEKIRGVFERYGFDPVETPMFEYTDALGKFLPDQDRPNEGVFSLRDDDGQWMSLRYDLTAPLARHVAQTINAIALPHRTYRAGWVFRNEKPGPGRFRQFMQFDADTIGAHGVQADAEMAMMMADTMEALGIRRGDYVIRVNNRSLLDAVLKARGVKEEQYTAVLRSLDKSDKFEWHQIHLLLTKGRLDESGDFTAGAGLSDEIASTLYRLFAGVEELSRPDEPFQCKIGRETIRFDQSKIDLFLAYEEGGNPVFSESEITSGELNWLIPLVVLLADPADGEVPNMLALIHLFQIHRLVRSAGYGPDRIRIDPSVVRGLEYYTGPVYEAELLFDVTNEKGETVRFGSVGGGGRYDGLVKRFTGQDVPATGFSIGVSRLMTALKNLGMLDERGLPAPVLVTVMDGGTEALGRYQKFTQDLREAGIRAEMYQGNWKKFGNQLRYADRRGCPIAVIQGPDERASGKIQLKDMIEGRRQATAIESNEEYRAARPGQTLIDQADLVATVQAMLADQNDG